MTSDAAALCLKAGNAVILRGGKEAIHSNLAIAGVMREAVAQAGLPRDSVQLVEDTSRQSSVELMELTEYLDVLIPRGLSLIHIFHGPLRRFRAYRRLNLKQPAAQVGGGAAVHRIGQPQLFPQALEQP